jgi:hypothetical protein
MYNFTVLHKSGKTNVNADTLSQLHKLETNTALLLGQDEEWIQQVKTVQQNNIFYREMSIFLQTGFTTPTLTMDLTNWIMCEHFN